MSVRSRRVSRIAVLGVLAALSVGFSIRTASAEVLTVDSLQSSATVTIGIGVFQDNDGSFTDPDGNSYLPDSLGPDGNPVHFFSLGNSVGQGDPSVDPLNIPGGVVPGFSDGSTAQLNGTVTVNPGAFAITGANLGLNVSGLWQPGTISPTDANGPPSASELGLYIDVAAAGSYLVANLNASQFSLSTGNVPLVGNNFSDPNGNLTLVTSTINGFAGGALATTLSTTLTNQPATANLTGTYTVAGLVSTLSVPFSAQTYADLSAVQPGLYASITESGQVVAVGVVPEPSSIVLVGMGLVGLAFARFRRIRK
jgi:hypothetical protein